MLQHHLFMNDKNDLFLESNYNFQIFVEYVPVFVVYTHTYKNDTMCFYIIQYFLLQHIFTSEYTTKQ